MVNLFIGLVLLIFGRKLFWLFVAAVGFVFGHQFAQAFFASASYWVVFGIGLLGGAVGALMAIFLQKIAIGIAGFAAGYAITEYAFLMLGWPATPLLYAVGGLLSAILLYLLFDWWLIALSSIAGAMLVLQYVNWTPLHELVLYSILLVGGVLCQTLILLKQKHPLGNPG